jgi:hypothetical protein
MFSVMTLPSAFVILNEAQRSEEAGLMLSGRYGRRLRGRPAHRDAKCTVRKSDRAALPLLQKFPFYVLEQYPPGDGKPPEADPGQAAPPESLIIRI